MTEKFHRIKNFVLKNKEVIFFIGGFFFDTFTMVRIDSTLDLVIQTLYLAIVAYLIVLKARQDHGRWTPPHWLHKAWEYESEALHFFYGGLLSAYVIFYFKSTTLSRSVTFFAFVVVLMFLNEMPQVRRVGATMRLGLYAFCLVSFLNYLLPVLIGRMNAWIFSAAWVISFFLSAALVNLLSKFTDDPKKFRWRFGWSPAVVLLLIAILYSEKLIPPVPLSMQYAGIYSNVNREGDKFRLTYQKPPWHAFWRHDDRVFKARPGDRVFFFTRVFAPRKFTHQIYLSWLKKSPESGEWQVSDRIPLNISGGRDQGYRGFAAKSNYEPGIWRVDVETEDGRALGGVKFTIENDPAIGERSWMTRWM